MGYAYRKNNRLCCAFCVCAVRRRAEIIVYLATLRAQWEWDGRNWNRGFNENSIAATFFPVIYNCLFAQDEVFSFSIILGYSLTRSEEELSYSLIFNFPRNACITCAALAEAHNAFENFIKGRSLPDFLILKL